MKLPFVDFLLLFCENTTATTTTTNIIYSFFCVLPCKLWWMQHESVSVVLILLLWKCFPGSCHLTRNLEIISQTLNAVGTRGDNSTKCCSFGEFCMNFPDAGKRNYSQIPQRMSKSIKFSHFSLASLSFNSKIRTHFK